MDVVIVAQFAVATLLPVAACVVLTMLRKRTGVSRVPEKAWQVIVGVVFGLIAIYGTEVGIPVEGATMNVRDAAPLAAGLFFGGPAGIIAGVIGGVERWFAVLWGAGEFTRLACTLGTIFAGVYAAALRKYVFNYHIPNLAFSFASGVVVEVLHLLLVFVTNLDQAAKGFAVVQACVIPMTLCVGLSTLLSSFALHLLNREPLITPAGQRNVVRILHTRMLIAIVVAFFVTVGFTAAVQTSRSLSDASELLKQSIEDVEGDVAAAQGDYASSAQLAVATLSSAVKNRHVGQTGELVVIDEAGSVISTRSGIPAESDARLAADVQASGAGQMFTTSFAGQECFAVCQQIDGYRVIALLPVSEAYASRDNSLLIVALMEVLVFASLFLVIHFVVKRVVVRGIRRMTAQLAEITKGDLDVEVDVRDATEFASLSNDINLTVGALKSSLSTLQADLDMAAEVQANVLPTITRVISSREEFELFSSMEPAKEVGGDFYDFFMIGDDHLALVVADVSGKGVPAALFMMLSKAVIKMETLSNPDPAAVLERANADLSEKNDDDMFTTVWLGVLEISTGTLTYADAGHEKLAFYRGGTWEVPRKPNGAVALAAFSEEAYAGIPEKYRYRNHAVVLQPGDAVFQYTDGVTEATDADEDLFGDERLLDALNEAPSASPGELLPFVRGRIAAFVGDAPQFDDITMLGLRYIGGKDKRRG